MRKRSREDDAPRESAYSRAASGLICVGVVAVSTTINKAATDTFRLPKEIASRAEAVLLIALAVFAATAANGRWSDLIRGIPRRVLFLCAAIVLWTLVTTAVSTNRLLSIESAITVIAAGVLFLGSFRRAPRLSWMLLDVCLAAAVLNAVFTAVQEWSSWNPFSFPADVDRHMRSTGLLGNPDDVGSYLLGPLVAALVGAYVLRGKRRWIYAAVTAVLFAGILASGSRTAFIALFVSTLALALYRPWKQSLAAVAVALAVVAIVFTASPGLRGRFAMLVGAARGRQYDVLFSERLVPFLAAIDMTRSRPWVGVGPGCFKYHYMDERLAVSRRYPAAWTRSWPQNFAQTHDDHLQVAAETGLPGYVLFLAAVLLVGTPSHLGDQDEPAGCRRVFARTLRVPLVTAFFVLAIAQFPLQIAAPRVMFLTLAALAMAWDAHA